MRRRKVMQTTQKWIVADMDKTLMDKNNNAKVNGNNSRSNNAKGNGNNATANNLLNQVNYRNFHHMLKRNETTGIRTYQPNYQPYGDAYGTSSQYGAGGYGGYGGYGY